jgi:hypothetical protein
MVSTNPFAATALFGTGFLLGIEKVKSDLIFEKLDHQTIHGPSG